MTEEIRKLDDNTVEITAEVKAPEMIRKDFRQLEDDLIQAKNSLVYVQQRYASEIAPIQETIDRLQKRVDDAKALGIIAKPVTEEPIIP